MRSQAPDVLLGRRPSARFRWPLWLLSEILLPFVAGLAIAYLLTPVTDRLERFGVNRLVAALLIITFVVFAFVYLILLVAPILGGQLWSFIDSVPGYVTNCRRCSPIRTGLGSRNCSARRLNTDKRSATW